MSRLTRTCPKCKAQFTVSKTMQYLYCPACRADALRPEEPEKKPVWMVWRDGLEPTPNTFGPFASREKAEEFLAEAMKFGTAWGGVYDATKNPHPR